jgi:predicted RNase H-like nuclease (RuvC/YqgF family)
MSLQSTLDELELLAENKQLRKQAPRLYKLVKEQIEVMREILRRNGEIARLENKLKKMYIRNSELGKEIEREVEIWQKQS